MSSATLDFPTLDAFDSYIEALREGFYVGIQPKATEEDIEKMLADPAAHLEKLNEPKEGVGTTPDGTEFPFVPFEWLWLIMGKEFIGAVSFRLKLSSMLQNFGGHIGYGIRPKYQGKGFGNQALALTKKRATQHAIDRLRLTCHVDNIASEKIILNNGGIHEDTIDGIYGFKGPTKRFWIELEGAE